MGSAGSVHTISAVFKGPNKQIIEALNFDYFLIHWLKHVFWVLERIISLRRLF